MLIARHAEIDIEPDEPVAALRAFARLLCAGAIDTDAARVDLNLVATSARGLAVVKDFKPERTRGAEFATGVAIIEELAQLPESKMKSLHLIMSARGFRWKGSPKGSTANALLFDGKSFRRKKRFHIAASLSFEAPSAEDPTIESLLHAIETESGLRFDPGSGHVQLSPQDEGRASDEELLLTTLTWHELIESLAERLPGSVELATVPHLMTAYQATRYLGDPERVRSSERIDFIRATRRWIKAEFAEYAGNVRGPADGYFDRPVTSHALVGLAVDKRVGTKSFTIWVSVGLTSKRFAPSAHRPARMAVRLSRLYGVAPVPLEWTYETARDLAEALSSATRLLRPVLALLEVEAPKLASAYLRRRSEFAGPRQVSAREAHDATLESARQWAADARLISVSAAGIELPFTWSMVAPAPLDPSGRLSTDSAWSLTFHSRRKEENLFVRLPCHGSVSLTTMHAPAGRQYPSDVDHILRDGWLDSPEALRLAVAAGQELIAGISMAKVLGCRLRSDADVSNPNLPALPLRDGMFNMRAWWSMHFSDPDPGQKRRIVVRVPAYDDEAARVEIYSPEGRLVTDP